MAEAQLISGMAMLALAGCATVATRPSMITNSSQTATVAPLVFDGVTVVDVEQGRHLRDQRVVIAGTRIQKMGEIRAVPIPVGAQVLDARGKYLIPGLWDMHTHPMHAIDTFFPLYIANGVTGIRDMGTPVPLDTVFLWRREIIARQRVGPRQVISGPYLDKSLNFPFSRVVTTPAEARRIIDSLHTAGVDFIKLRDLSPKVYFAAAAEARRLGLAFGGHVPSDLSPDVLVTTASDSGASVVDHSHHMIQERRCLGDSASIERCAPVAERFRRNGTWFAPTLIVHAAFSGKFAWDAPRRATITSVLPNLHLGVVERVQMPLLAGTDASSIDILMNLVPPGTSLHEELALMVSAGVTPLRALQAATLNPAKLLHATDSLGTVAFGKVADLVLLDADPLTDITNTTKIRAVVANGRYFDRAALDQLLSKPAPRLRSHR